jgi:uncharacterized membrane protein
MLWSFILISIALLNMEGITLIILGLPFIIFIPGYILIFAIFPTRKTDRGIDIIERIALSFSFSIAVVSLIGFGLNYTPWGIRLETILPSIFIFVIGIGTLAIYRWFNVNQDERYTIRFNLSQLKSNDTLVRFLNVIIIISLLLAVVALSYVIITPKQGENFTEFYLFGSRGNTTDYPKEISIGKNYTVNLVVANHEYKTINYTIEIWLINQSEDKDETIIQNMWFVDKIITTLEHTNIEIRKTKTRQWEYNYSFGINRTGSFKITFLLFKTPTEEYIKNVDYREIAEQKTSSTYRAAHLWINVN